MPERSVNLGVAVVGLGFGARVHVPGWSRLPGVTVRTFTRDWRDAVEDATIDVVSIATPPASHAEIALASLRAGKAVLCEKPLAATVAEAERLVRAALRPAAVNFSYRAVPAFAAAHEILASGSIGALTEIDIRWHASSRLLATGWSWRDQAGLGGGALTAYGIHALDYVTWLGGAADRVEASLTLPAVEREGRRVTSDDACHASIQHRAGGRTTLDISLVSEERVHRVMLTGTDGTMTIENGHPSDPVGTFALTLDGRPVELPRTALPSGDDDPRTEPFAGIASGLASAVRRGGPVSPSFADGLRAQVLLDAALESAARGVPVRVRPTPSDAVGWPA